MEALIVIAYTAWAFYSGYKVLSGRSEWLDQKAPLNIAVKLALSVALGYVIAAFYLIYLILRFFGCMSKM